MTRTVFSRITCATAMLAAAPLAAQRAPTATPAPAPRALIIRALDAIGGEGAVRELRSTVTDFTSVTFALGQEETPESPPRATIASGRFVIDWTNRRRVQTVSVTGPGGPAVRQRRVTANSIGMVENDGRQTPDAPNTVAGVLRGMALQPNTLLLAAAEAGSGLRRLPPKRFRGESMDGVRLVVAPDTVDLYFDRINGLLVVSESVVDDPILGDRHTLTWYQRWQDAGGGIKLPRQVDTEVNGRILSHNVVQSLVANAPIADSLFAIPDSIASRAQQAPAGPPTPAPITVTLVELAPGVWRAEGGSHHSLVVDQGAQLVVVEAPQHERRMRAVLDTLTSRFPTKTVGTVVSTHHHWDHSGGLRAAMAAGIRVVTHTRNVPFTVGIAEARKTKAPDALTRRVRRPTVRPVNDSVMIGTGERRVVVYTIPTTHVEGMLAAYVPAARVLFISDIVTPGPTQTPAAAAGQTAGARELVAFARARGITVDRLAAGHGPLTTWAQIGEMANR